MAIQETHELPKLKAKKKKADDMEMTWTWTHRMEGFKKPSVVIIGAQFAGRRVYAMIKAQRPDWSCVLISDKDYFEYTPAVLRALVTGDSSNVLVPVSPDVMVGTATHVFSNSQQVGSVPGGFVELASGEKLPFDFLVLATGSCYAPPIKPSSHLSASAAPSSASEVHLIGRRRALAAVAAHVLCADRIVIIGGGAVGVELAAEIAGHYGKKKRVTVLTPSSRCDQKTSVCCICIP